MTPATAANEYRSNLGPAFSMFDAFEADYLDTDAIEGAAVGAYKPVDVESMGQEERRTLNARMAECWGC
jgi:hypothetical protein